MDRAQTNHQPAARKRKAPPAQAGPFERTPQLRGSGHKRVAEDERIVGDFHAGSSTPPPQQRRGGKGSSPKKKRKNRVAGVRGRAGPHGPLRGVNFSRGRSPGATGQTKTDAAAFTSAGSKGAASARGPYLTPTAPAPSRYYKSDSESILEIKKGRSIRFF